jgi:glucose-1-phosphate thymidylyltransferase
MQVIIPMAGYGTRLRPLTFSRPKPLLPVAGAPMIRHVIDSLNGIDVDEYIFIVGYLGNQIEEYVRQNYNVKAHFVVQEELIGQAHAIYLTREYLNGPAIVLFADTLFQADLGIIKKTTADAVAFVKEVEDPRRFGVVEVDEKDKVTRFIEKPDSMENKNVVIGLYYLRDSAPMITAIEKQMATKNMTRGEFFIADAFQIMVQDGAVFNTSPVGVWLDCGKPETVLETNRYLLENGHANESSFSKSGVAVIPPSFIHPSALIESSVIGPYASIGAGCQIKDSFIRDSIIDDNAVVQSIHLDQSLVGIKTNVAGKISTLNIGDESSLSLT